MTTTYVDPWAEPVAPEPTPEAAPEPKSAGITIDVVPTQAGGTESKITLTFKGAGGYGDRWLVAHVVNPDEGLTLLNDPKFKELLDLSKRIASYDGAGAPAAAPQGGNTGGRQGTPQGATQAPSWAPPKPEHDFVYKTGVSKAGNTWHAWMPPTKEDNREAKFFWPPK